MRRAMLGFAVAATLVATLVGVGVVVAEDGGGGASPPAHRVSPGADAPPAAVQSVWTKAVPGWPAQLTADERGVVVVSGNRFVSAFAPEHGARRWETAVPGRPDPFVEPAIDANTVLVSAGDRFVALERADGAIRWEAPAGTAAGAAGVALVATAQAGTVAMTATVDGRLVGRDVETGAEEWSVTGAGSLDAHLAADASGGRVVAVWRVADIAMVRVFDAVSGALRWEQPVEPMVASPVIGGGLVVVAAGDGDYRAHVHAFKLDDGRVEWTTPVPGSFEPDLVPGIDLGRSRAAVIGVQDHLGTVSLLDLRTGAVRWGTETRVPALGGRLLLTSDVVVVRNEGQQLVILDRSRGHIRARRKDPAGLPGGIAAVGERVIVGWRWTRPGRIDALEIEIAPSRP